MSDEHTRWVFFVKCSLTVLTVVLTALTDLYSTTVLSVQYSILWWETEVLRTAGLTLLSLGCDEHWSGGGIYCTVKTSTCVVVKERRGKSNLPVNPVVLSVLAVALYSRALASLQRTEVSLILQGGNLSGMQSHLHLFLFDGHVRVSSVSCSVCVGLFISGVGLKGVRTLDVYPRLYDNQSMLHRRSWCND